MRRTVSICCIALVALGTVILASSARAGGLSPEAFYGRFVGAGFTFGDFAYNELTMRDLDVEIGPEGDGFFVAWTTVFRPPNAKKPRRKASRASFVPTERPGVYVERSAKNRVGEGLTWAMIDSPMLTIFVLKILEDSSYAVQTYHRILFEKGMMLQFKNARNGQTIRMISAKLTKKK